MAGATADAVPEDVDYISATPRRRRITRWALYGIAGVLAFIFVTLFALDTPPGRRFLIDRIEALEPANGLRVRIGRIDGSIYGRMTISDLRLYDPEGLFFEAPELDLDWQPGLFLLDNRLHIDSLSSDLAILHRTPALVPSEEEGQPILPGFDIHVGSLDIVRLRFEEAVAGQREHVSLAGNADIRSGRALVQLRSQSLDSGERLTFALDAEPDGDVFDVDLQLYAPEDGILAGLTGIERSLAMDIAGSGTWESWNGRAQIDSGEARVVDLDLEANDGAFVLGGVVRSTELLDPGVLRRLTAPEMNLSARATLENRSLAGDFDIRSPSAVIEGRGVLDLAESAFDGFAARFRLLDPSALVANMSGSDVRMSVGLDGPFDRAEFRYELTAPRAAFGGTGFDNLRIGGEGRLGQTPFTLPVAATASRITGLGETFDDVVRNVSVDGNLLITDEQIVGDDLLLRSDRLRGDISTIYDLASGNYAAAFNGDIDRFRLPGLGIFDIRTRVDVRPASGGNFVIAGEARAVTRQLENSFFQTLSGGPPVVDASIAYGPDGRFAFTDMQLRSPSLRFNGSGYLDGGGELYISGSGQQAQYGPLTVTAQGAPSRPRVELTLANPVPSARVADVNAVLEPNERGYLYTATGQSMGGPFASSGVVALPTGAPVSITVSELLVADTRTSGGFAFRDGGMVGLLELTGIGVTGDIQLLTEGGEQLVVVDIDAENARLGGEIDATVRRAMLDLRWRPLEDLPRLEGSVELYGLRRRNLSLARFDGSVELEGGHGTADFNLGGARGRNFDFSAQAVIAPGDIGIEGGGSFRGEPIELTPLTIRQDENGWVIPESTISYAGGGATLSGRFGGSVTQVDANVDSVPLSLIDIAYPDTGFGGLATGMVHYRQSDDSNIPTGHVELRIRSLTREGFALRPRPVNLGINARLENRRLATRAIMESDGEEIMRFQARLDPIAGEGNFGDLLAVAPLFAELRYNGSAETLWQLTGNEVLSLSGPLFADLNIEGTLDTPDVSGELKVRNGRLESALTGTVVEGVSSDGTFAITQTLTDDGIVRQSRLEFPSLSGTTPGGGSISGSASFDLGLASGFGMNVELEADRAWLLRRDDISAQVSGPLTITLRAPPGTAIGTANARPVGEIRGDFDMVRGEFALGQAAPSIIVPTLNVTEINRPLDEPEDRPVPVNWTLNVDVNARNRFMVRGLGLDSEWSADIDVRGPLENFQILGAMNLRRGSYEFAGRSFELERGRIEFYGNQPVDPVLDIVAVGDAEGLDAMINIGGTGNSPEIRFTSTPALPTSELLSRLLFGTSITNLSAPEALQLGAAVASLQTGGGGGLNPINAVRDAIGLDRLRVLPADPAEGRGTAVAAGVYVTRRLFVEVISDGQGYSATETEFRITRWLSLLSSISTLGRVETNLQISRDY
ncbi:translocation/assembly module TamB domain-containing protein [Parasphingopyxis lamellibrachiae]|uniref:Autotransporter secretion inner membrane protein TamB n=1 Tax=Parasphingopyxis lamellibrachiae TaxID=680125 RepID=A0A3D9FE70_9SPHN|nr:translocation/assembly module TamB domain-containing protein [Parasphingopyxis lamellibrachiae]RED16120.1 autotransporter secretion inner membrane protein TamB [Parasphingopyxis lamellibrachiae]